jgi:hypothetical protein
VDRPGHATGDVKSRSSPDQRSPSAAHFTSVNRARLVDSDGETLRALVTAAGDRDLLTHARWLEILGRGALTIRFYRALERAVATIADSSAVGPREARSEIALLDTSRLLFLSFLEAKGWLDGDRAFLSHQFDRCTSGGKTFHDRVLRPLFFGTLQRRSGDAVAARAFGQSRFSMAACLRERHSAPLARHGVLRRRVRVAALRPRGNIVSRPARRRRPERGRGGSGDVGPGIQCMATDETTHRCVFHPLLSSGAW